MTDSDATDIRSLLDEVSTLPSDHERARLCQGSAETSPPLIPATPDAAIYFSLGVLDAVVAVCATLVGREVLEPETLQQARRKRIAHTVLPETGGLH